MPQTKRNRIRQRHQQGRFGFRSSGSSTVWYPLDWVSHSIHDWVPGPGNCFHTKCDSGVSGSLLASTGNSYIWENMPVSYDSWSTHVQSHLSSLNWGKLPSSTETGIIQILAEIDDTIELFTRRFWRNLSYGSWTWGVLPFVNDLVAVSKAVRNLSLNLRSFDYEDEVTVPLDFIERSGTGVYHCVGKAKIRKTGVGDLSFQSPGSLALDWLGFHPDLATAWDLLPLSFLLDYLLPIGDYLESFRQGGWVKVMMFNGWVTVKVALTVYASINEPGWPTDNFGKCDVELFRRYASSDVLVVQPDNSDFPSFNAPSLREMMNMLYVLTGGLRRKLPANLQ